MTEGKQSKGKFTQVKDLYFPKGCGSLNFQLVEKSDIVKLISPLARSFSSPSHLTDSDYAGAAQNLNEQFADAPAGFAQARRSGNKNDGFYYPDFSGRYIHDNRGQYIPDNRGLYVHIPGPDGPPALPYEHVIGPFGPDGPDGT